ncbi:MAG: DUF3800 domain-containing protein [Desulfovibrionaceae bacterium]|nr:DUF3800 domain-containing protein [Desulfovibrionaceae bacterium]
MPDCRLYIDEVGNSDLGASENENHRYLSLTGVIIRHEYVSDTVHPLLEALKTKHFTSHPDDPIILHRKELVNKKYPFSSLRDKENEMKFNDDLLVLLGKLEYKVITIVIDKLEHKQIYSRWLFDPYHYCLAVMLERFVRDLELNTLVGDVLAESRGGKEDRRLKDSFQRLVQQGTEYVSRDVFTATLSSGQLKVKPKQFNISGLQLADIIAHPSYKCTLHRRQKKSLPDNFGGKIAQLLEKSKYHRSPSGVIDGWGRKWLP